MEARHRPPRRPRAATGHRRWSRPAALRAVVVKKRLDVLLVGAPGLAGARAQAQALVMAGSFRDTRSPGEQLEEDAPGSRWASRRPTSRAAATSSRTRSTHSASSGRGSTASTRRLDRRLHRRPAPARGRDASSRSTSATGSCTENARRPACGVARARERALSDGASVRAAARHLRRFVHRRCGSCSRPALAPRLGPVAGARARQAAVRGRAAPEAAGGVVRDAEVQRRVLARSRRLAPAWQAQAAGHQDSGLPPARKAIVSSSSTSSPDPSTRASLRPRAWIGDAVGSSRRGRHGGQEAAPAVQRVGPRAVAAAATRYGEARRRADGGAAAPGGTDLALVLGGDGTMLRALTRFLGTRTCPSSASTSAASGS